MIFWNVTKLLVRHLLRRFFNVLVVMGLDLTKLRGQAYDGARNMSGRTKGASTLISEQYPLALYLHCASHYLNLVVVKSLQDTSKYIIIIFSVQST